MVDPNELSFKQKDFNLNEKVETNTLNNISYGDTIYFDSKNNMNESPKFSLLKEEDIINKIEKEIPEGLDLRTSIQQEIGRKESKKTLEVHSSQLYPTDVKIEHAKKSHFEYLRFIKENKDPLGIQNKGGLRAISKEELSLHNKKHDLWLAINGGVFDLTMYLEYHPGGEEMLMKGAGKDATELFNYHHPWINLHNLVGKLQVGYMKIN